MRLIRRPVLLPLWRRVRPSIEVLEERAVPTTFSVILPTDVGFGIGTFGDFRYCLAQANSNPGPDTIQFASPFTVDLLSPLPFIDDPVDIVGVGAASTVLRRAAGAANFGILSVQANVDVSISGLTITNGNAIRGGGIDNLGTLTISDCIISGNHSPRGGGIDNENGGTLTLLNSTISGNSAGGLGGGIESDGTLTLSNCTITGNTATLPGSSGGGLAVAAGTVNINDSTISGNAAVYGAGIANLEGTLTISNSTISANSAVREGGGIFSNGDTLTISNSTISGNSAGRSGGGIENGGGALAISNSTISGNSAVRVGGGILSGGTLTINNSTISGNSTSDSGGGIFSSGSATLVNLTIAGNHCDSGNTGDAGRVGGGICVNAGTLTLSNSLVAGNFKGSGSSSANDIAGAVDPSSGFNLIGTGGSGGLINGVNNNLVGVANPGLGPLGNNGGPTQTMALLPGSPAIDAGNPASAPATDQRGLARFGNTDIGAFEYQFKVTNTADSGLGSLRQAVLNANATTTADTIIFTSLFNTPQTITLNGGQLTLTDPATTTVSGPGANLLSISGNDTSRVFQINGEASAALSGLTITGGMTAGRGAGLSNDGTVTLTDSTISGNSAEVGGGVRTYGTTTLNNCTISGNSASNLGGGLFQAAGTTTLTNCTFSGNSAAATGGGGLWSQGGTLTMTNCTVSGNSAPGSYGGGGLFTFSSTTLTNCTFSGNSASQFGGVAAMGTTTLSDTIIAGNTAAGTGPDVGGTVTSNGHNLIGKTDGSSGWVGTDLTGTIAAPLNALLASLGNNGGPTQTMALLPGSPAIDAGNPGGQVMTDQRGVGRPQGNAPDIGAFELRALSYQPAGDGQGTEVGQPFLVPLAVRVTEGGEPLAGVPVTFTVLPGDASATFPGGASQVTVTTDANGNAVAPTLTTGTVVPNLGAILNVKATVAADPNAIFFNLFVNPGPVGQYVLSAPSPVDPGASFSLTVTPQDQFGNETLNGVSSVHFTSSDPRANLPPDFTFPSDTPTATVVIPGFTLNTSGTQTITLTDQSEIPITASIDVQVIDEPPQNLQLSLPGGSTMQEGQTFTLQGTFTDPGGDDQIHQVTIAWGDGSTDTFAVAAGVFSFSRNHTFTEGLPAGPSATVPIAVIVSDGTSSGSASIDVTVINVPPVVDPGDSEFANAGSLMTHTINLTDPGTAPLTLAIDFGDGTTQTIQTTERQFTVLHTYQADGSFFVTITASDDQGGQDTESFRADVLLPGVTERARQETVPPGQTGTVSVPGATATVVRSADSQGNGVLILAVVPTAVTAFLDPASTVGLAVEDIQMVASFDIRAINMGSEDVAIIRMSYEADSANHNQPILLFFNKATGRQEAVGQDDYKTDPVAHVIVLRLDRFSTPPLQGVPGTVFTVALPQEIEAEPVTTTAVPTTVDSPKTLTESASPHVVALGSVTLQSGPTLAVVQASSPTTPALLPVTTTVEAVGPGTSGGGGEGSTASGGGGAIESGPLRELPPAPASLMALPEVTVSPSRLELPSLRTPRPPANAPREMPPQEAPEEEDERRMDEEGEQQTEEVSCLDSSFILLPASFWWLALPGVSSDWLAATRMEARGERETQRTRAASRDE
jgi:hypothetical protein